ncbi:MAG: 3-hydroxyacyl-ACP dehydratase FabZ [Dictyoglomaceae bacterium]|nr:3-hydroxyacyl-ACP dehydratase FabZ [Dictyoglomaceae bacterium]HPU43182.1 3-hydroxyacyl-ACP dehydratase FabZ [Dictyoglomaceae bacterium]
MDVDILKVLPHRFPFLLVDKVLDFKEGEMIRAVKNVSYNDYFFMGHFPEKPIMPGVLIIEAMAQTAGLFLYLSYAEKKENYAAYLTGVDNMKFRKPVFPGDQLILEVKLEKSLQNIFKFHGLGKVEENLVAEGEITIALGQQNS